MTTISEPMTHLRRGNVALAAARLYAGLLGSMQLACAFVFLVVIPEDTVWVGPWLDVPVVALMLTQMLLKLAVAVGPGLTASGRIRLGMIAVAIGVTVTLVKIPVYDEPEGVLFLAFDGILLGLLLLARRGRARQAVLATSTEHGA